jgi:FixJ family two-component response regulator
MMKKITVAVVEDDYGILDALRLVLEMRGWNIRGYANAEAFLAEIDTYKPDCVVLDPHLPLINGAEVARRLTDGNRIPFIALTARPTSAITTAVAELGAHAILTKPVSADDLIAHIEAAILALRTA